jgi:uncharacterized protein YfiM (DUF2279 family)
MQTPPKNPNGENTYRSSDLYFSAYLLTAGVEMVGTERSPDGRKVSFIFDSSVSNIEALKMAWSNHQGKVPALPYANAIKSLKSIVHMQ